MSRRPATQALQTNSVKATVAESEAGTQERPNSTANGRSDSGDWAWIFGSLILTTGTAAPALYLASHWNQIVQMAPQQRTASILTIDGIFILTATLFLYCGHQFGLQRHGQTLKYPGPFKDLDGSQRLPDYFVPYVSVIVLIAFLAPAAGLGFLIWLGQADLGISTLGVYLLCAVLQVASESTCLRLGSTLWPQVPQSHQPYRLWQLARGLFLSSAVGGPEWLQTLQGFLILVWVFNYGTQLTFAPWLYRWHLQPKQHRAD